MMVDASEILSLMAELGIGLAGFSAVVVAFSSSRRSGEALLGEAIKGIIVVPLILVNASVIPLVGSKYAALTGTGWQIASGILLVALLADLIRGMWQARRAAVAGRLDFKLRHYLEFLPVLILYSPILANALGYFESPEAGYLIGLCVPLVISCILFYRTASSMLNHETTQRT